MKSKLKKNDTVIVIAGKDKGRTGRLLRIDHEKNRAVVEGLNMVKKAQRQKNQNETGGIIEREAAIDLSNLMYVGKDGKPARLGYRVEGSEKVRFNRRTGETV